MDWQTRIAIAGVYCGVLPAGIFLGLFGATQLFEFSFPLAAMAVFVVSIAGLSVLYGLGYRGHRGARTAGVGTERTVIDPVRYGVPAVPRREQLGLFFLGLALCSLAIMGLAR